MDILLDECIDQRLARELPGHNVRCVPQMNWAGLKNGRLLALAEQQSDVFLTVDRNLSFQQNVSQFAMAVVVLRAPTNRLHDLKPLVPAILLALPTAQPGQVLVLSAPPQADAD